MMKWREKKKGGAKADVTHHHILPVLLARQRMPGVPAEILEGSRGYLTSPIMETLSLAVAKRKRDH